MRKGQEEAILEIGGKGNDATKRRTEKKEPIGKEETFITTLTGLCVYSGTVALAYRPPLLLLPLPLEEARNTRRQTLGRYTETRLRTKVHGFRPREILGT